MTKENQVVDPILDNSTPPDLEIEDQVTPLEDNVTETELEEPVELETEVIEDDIIEDEREERYKQQLSGSKAEALRLKAELEELKDLQKAKREQEDAGIPINEQDLAAFNALAKRLGFVTSEELDRKDQVKTYTQTQEDSLNKFLTEHPGYNKPGDPESDKRWIALQKELTYYNTSPSDPKVWYSILKKAHNNLNNDSGIAQARGESIGMAKANLAEQAKMGNRASGEVSIPTRKQTPEQQQFSQEIDEQLKKKPYYKGT